ncbi:MAG: iron-containing alcohol dehydrogenase family protein [Ruminococcaceae bacterium]|nr:iron-containing alcohol dehydrogenase family protein [Oscillospiraceae bacterium]
MATKSRVVESSFRFGCGRYVQESGAAARLPEEVRRLHGTHLFIIGGKTAFSLALPVIEPALKVADMPYSVHDYPGFCCVETCEELMATEAFALADVVIGIGGGNVCDAAKYMAVKSDRPVILIPTSAATCACFTPLSVTYTKDFRRAGSYHHDREVNGVLVDMDIMCLQPERLLASGVYDAAAKMIEIEQRVRDIPENDIDVGLNASYALSKHTYERMLALFPEAVEALNAKKSNKALYDLVYLNIAATGLISGMARGSNQCAIAHKIYDLSRALFPSELKDYLHGEIVGIGLLAQLYYNGREDEVEGFAADMRSHGLPTTLSALGVHTEKEENRALLYNNLLTSTAMAGTDEEEHKRLQRALAIIW